MEAGIPHRRDCRHILVSGFLIFGGILLPGCGGGRYITFEQKLLGEADSLFRAGNYEYAKVKFDKVRNAKPNSPSARTAQYYLGYINIYHDNPFTSTEAALREFKRFVSQYPDDLRLDEVHTWIKMLTLMQSYNRGFEGATSRITELNEKLKAEPPPTQQSKTASTVNVDALTESLRNCIHVRDSLDKKSRDLENFILYLEKECVQGPKR